MKRGPLLVVGAIVLGVAAALILRARDRERAPRVSGSDFASVLPSEVSPPEAMHGGR